MVETEGSWRSSLNSSAETREIVSGDLERARRPEEGTRRESRCAGVLERSLLIFPALVSVEVVVAKGDKDSWSALALPCCSCPAFVADGSLVIVGHRRSQDGSLVNG